MPGLVYLDYNATAPMRPEVKEAMHAHAGQPLNPSSIHASGRAARKIVEDARAKILAGINAKSLIFCGSATEANNLALAQGANFLVSAIEHESIYKLAKPEQIVRVNANGVIDLEALKKQLQARPALVSVMLANNETGIIQPIKEVVKLAKEAGALIHTDAVQAYGRINIDFAELGVDLMSISSHKAGGPVGAAALVFRADIELKPITKGGGQEKNKRPGTENVLAIHGLASLSTNVPRETGLSELNKFLESELEKLGKGFVVVGRNENRLPNTTCLIHPKLEASTQLIHFDSEGVCVSSGSACSSGKVEVSRTLSAMDMPSAKNAIRISTGWATTKADVEAFLRAILKLGNT